MVTQLYQRDTEDLLSRVDCLQQEIQSQQTSSQITLQDTERELREVTGWAKQKEAELRKRESEYARFLHTVCSLVSDNKVHVEQQLSLAERDLSQVLSQEQERTERMSRMSQQLKQHH
ncbi:hypothetical protein ACOMHN_061079 [Nucella lapillus]